MPISNGTQGLIKNPDPVPGHCSDCNMDYTVSEQDHWLFCDARTCGLCLNSYDRVIPADEDGHRICTTCQNDLDSGEFNRDSEEDDDNGVT